MKKQWVVVWGLCKSNPLAAVVAAPIVVWLLWHFIGRFM